MTRTVKHSRHRARGPGHFRALRVTSLQRETCRFRCLVHKAKTPKSTSRMIALERCVLERLESLDFHSESARAPPGVTALQFTTP
jgi:hypothetical protein